MSHFTAEEVSMIFKSGSLCLSDGRAVTRIDRYPDSDVYAISVTQPDGSTRDMVADDSEFYQRMAVALTDVDGQVTALFPFNASNGFNTKECESYGLDGYASASDSLLAKRRNLKELDPVESALVLRAIRSHGIYPDLLPRPMPAALQRKARRARRDAVMKYLREALEAKQK